MSLCGRKAGETVLFDKAVEFAALKVTLFDGQGADHLHIGQGHVTRARGFCDIRILHLRRVIINIRDFQSGFFKRHSHQRGDDVLR